MRPGDLVDLGSGIPWTVVEVFAGGDLLTVRPPQTTEARRQATRSVLARNVRAVGKS